MAHNPNSIDRLENEDFVYPSSLLASAQPSISPVKATRTLNTSNGRKRSARARLDPPPPKRLDTKPSLLLVPVLQSPTTFSTTEPSPYELYMEAVFANCAGFYRLSAEFFVVQGWDVKRARSSDHWHHLHFIQTSDGSRLGCSCPNTLNTDCFHRQFFRDYNIQDLAYSMDCSPDGPQVFFRQLLHDGSSVTKLSVPGAGTALLKSRVIVTHQGTSLGSGEWHCSKDQSRGCPHIEAALKALAARLSNGDDDGLEANMEQVTNDSQALLLKASDNCAVSYLPILPPTWAQLPTDEAHYPRPAPVLNPPSSPLPLGAQSQCSCRNLCKFDPSKPTVTRACKVFALTQFYPVLIELQPCPVSPASHRRFIGPDLRDLGLFNFNNFSIFSHDLLDDYTSSFSTSETPFVAWITVVTRRYEAVNCVFVGEDFFRSVWFGFAKLQDLSSDMVCMQCGIHPETIIWDGVTLAFGRKKLVGSLSPPTISGPTAQIRPFNKNHPHQQLIKDATLRKQIRQIIQGPFPMNIETSNDSDIDDEQESTNESIKKKQEKAKAVAALAHVKLVDAVRLALNHICPSLSDLVHLWFGPAAFSSGVVVPSEYRNFLRQVAAEESVIQMINLPSLNALCTFLLSPHHEAHYLISMPSIYRAFTSTTPFDDFISILLWIGNEARNVASILLDMVEPKLEHTAESETDKQDWTKTGCYYSMPKIRQRPVYPRLRSDQAREKVSNRGGKCSKYYTHYGQQRLTGGIVAAWCTHSICYGFHCVPESEGRNDIFSAMVAHWPTAPRRVIYDFACALGPYCMIREPEFFARTSFLIDHFHSTGHTKCSRACFLSEYANTDPALSDINSSAAECGNGGMKKIRKSVSYMSQERAIIYTKVYLSVWNRTKLVRMFKNT